MSQFEENGVNLQIEATSVCEAKRRFEASCNICCCRGLRIECDCCCIASTHKDTIAYLEDYQHTDR